MAIEFLFYLLLRQVKDGTEVIKTGVAIIFSIIYHFDTERFDFPMTGDVDFWCTNNDNSLEPLITPGDIIALKKPRNWKDYIPGKYICVVVTKNYKLLLKVSVTQNDPDSITFIQIDDGKPLECKISKDNILEIYHVVFRISRL